VEEVTKDLPLSQSTKIKSISESVDFTSEHDFRNKLKSIRESYYPSQPQYVNRNESLLNETLIEEPKKPVIDTSKVPEMQLYLKTVKNFAKK
jgi:hypothetical protein